jgi:hypothetical protein
MAAPPSGWALVPLPPHLLPPHGQPPVPKAHLVPTLLVPGAATLSLAQYAQLAQQLAAAQKAPCPAAAGGAQQPAALPLVLLPVPAACGRATPAQPKPSRSAFPGAPPPPPPPPQRPTHAAVPPAPLGEVTNVLAGAEAGGAAAYTAHLLSIRAALQQLKVRRGAAKPR